MSGELYEEENQRCEQVMAQGARPLTCRGAAAAAAAFGACVFAPLAPAQNYPTRTVEIVVPFAVGGSNDILARLIGEGLSKRLGQPFVPLNRPGANTNTGTLQVVKAAPDGYTLADGHVRACGQSVALSEAAVRAAARSRSHHADRHRARPSGGAAVAAGGHRSAELVAYLKARPGELNYASYGVGSSPHLAAELFQSLTGTQDRACALFRRRSGDVGVMGNNVQMLIGGIPPMLGMVRGGQLKAIALAADRRSPLLPEVPTFIESGLDFRAGPWFGLLAPAKTPGAIIGRCIGKRPVSCGSPKCARASPSRASMWSAARPSNSAPSSRTRRNACRSVIRNANIHLD